MAGDLSQVQHEIEQLYQERAVMLQQLNGMQMQLATLQQNQQVPAVQAHVDPKLKIPKPPVFTGRNREPSPQNWTYQMENYLLASNVNLDTPAAVTYAAGFLADTALTWHRIYRINVQGGRPPYASWTEFKTALTSRFTFLSAERTARQKLSSLRQTGSVRSYAQAYNLCMIELPEMNERDRMFRFMEGLKPEVRIHVELKEPTNLSQAMELAIQTDSLLQQVKKGPSLVGNGGTYSRITSKESSHTPMEIGLIESKVTSPQQNRNQATAKPDPKGGVRCYYCGRLGHIKKDCRKRQKHLGARSPSN